MLNKFFGLAEKKTTVRVELLAGATTFLTMAYIVFVNPSVLSQAGMDKNALVVVTCVVTAAATIIAGLVGRAPIAMAPGMGLNAFFAYSLVLGDGLHWQTALGAVFLSGLLFLLLSFFGLRRKLVEAIPRPMVSAISVGIGLFITFIGLVNLGVVINNEQTLVSAGKLTPKVLIGLAGLMVMIFLETKGIRGSLLIGIIFSTILASVLGYIKLPEEWFSMDIDMSKVAFKLDIWAAFKWSVFGSVFSLMIMDLFDSIGTLVACCHQAEMVDQQGRIKHLHRLLGIDAFATMLGAVLGTSTTTAYVESAAGIEQGGRSGLTAVVTGLLFLAALVFVPVVSIVPEYATAPALVMVGLFMMKEVKQINFAAIEQGFPAFIIMVMIALSYSISTGLAFGFISYVIIKTVSGKPGEVKPAMWVIALLSLLFLIVERMPQLVAELKNIM